jgi:Hydrazine synthase alpha subunit middle domain/Concanavalin A-like lectin/glucanases superfamily
MLGTHHDRSLSVLPRAAALGLVVLAVVVLAVPARSNEKAPGLDRRLIHHWTCDEPGGVVLSDAVSPAGSVKADRAPGRSRGVFGQALDLRGASALPTTGPRARELAGLTIAAWVRPTDLSGFREIFRRECAHRVLFSFQDNGTVLSLGLDVGGYVECDAAIRPALVLDGRWHHAAATFDGKFMRVYLDGREITALERPGTIANDPTVPAFIGSMGSVAEHFQGGLDDLRMYDAPLAPSDLAALHLAGLEALAKASKETEAQLAAVYVPGRTFAETLAGTRQRMIEQGVRGDRDLAGVILARLRLAFPAAYDQFATYTGASLLDYVTSDDPELLAREAGRLVELLVEYRPVTADQKARQSPEQARHWAEVAPIEARLASLKAGGKPLAFDPGWIDLILEAGPQIQFRPVVNEAVAPYVTPRTPETKDLTPAEARLVLERDWMHQCGQNPSPGWIRGEIGWTRAQIARLEAEHPGLDFAKERAALADLEARAATLSQPDRALYFRVRALKRSVMFRNPLVDFDQLLLVDGPFPQGSEWNHETRHRLGYMAVPGGRLLVLKGLGPDGVLRQLAPQAPLHGSFWRPDLSFDGRSVVFSFKPHNEKAFHLYRLNVDGTGLVQLTDGLYDDLDPIFLPDGHILFSTTRGHTYVRCMPPTNAFVLARCDGDGKNLYLVSYNNEPDYTPSVMNDGRVVYTRWEYTDKPLWRAEKLWTMNPDGTQVVHFWGNQSVWPDLMKDARSIPGSRRVMFTGSAHHNWFSGSIGIIDPERGCNFPYGLTKVTAEVPWPESGNGPVDPLESADYHASGAYVAYDSPYPLGERDFLASADRGGKFVLYLMDVSGNRELIHEGIYNAAFAQPLRPRPRPPVLADRVAWPTRDQRAAPRPGLIFSSDVYQGAPPELRGRARFLRVMHIDEKTYTYWYKRPYISTGPVVSAVQSEGVKRILGTVPIEPDGSVSFEAPPSMALHFQLLDENQRALQTMRSFVGVMPGERRGCLGCHESHSRAPEIGGEPLALRKPPRTITPPPWSDTSVSYPRYVQPVLDRYCVKCHGGDGKANQAPDLTFRPGPEVFSEPYLTLIGRPSWGQPYQAPKNPPPGFGIADMIMVEGYHVVDPAAYVTPLPMTRLSYASRLIALCADSRHHGVKVDPVSLLRLIVWVDAMCPYRGDEEVRALDDPVFQGVDWLAIRPLIKTAPTPIRPGPVD